MDEVQPHDFHVLLQCPLGLADVWVQVVMPALTALLADASWKALRDLSPVARAILSDEPDEDFVFLHCPSASDTVADVIQLQPPCVALDL